MEHMYSVAGFYPVKQSDRKVYDFGPDWRFYLGSLDGAWKKDFDDSGWEIVALPHGLELLKENASGMRNYQGTAWYRKHFHANELTNDRMVYLYFEAVMGKCHIYLNGFKISEHFGGYLPFCIDISEKLLPGENIVAVMADNSDDNEYPPGTPQDGLDFAYLGGIYRDVYLIETPKLHVTDTILSDTLAGGGVFVAVLEAYEDRAILEISIELKNDAAVNDVYTLETAIFDAENIRVHASQMDGIISAGEKKQLRYKTQLTGVRLWYLNDPYQHILRVTLKSQNGTFDIFDIKFGIRVFEMRGDDGMFINNKWVGEKLSGGNRHQDYVYVGNALPKSGQWRDAIIMREGGLNIVRAAHYPLSPAFMDACDELGLLVTVATPGWQFYNQDCQLFRQRIKQDVRAMVRRDRNRPAVCLWEAALNETDQQPIDILKELHRIVHEEFPYTGAYTATDWEHAKAAGFDFYYHGGMNEEKCSFTREYGDGEEVDNFYSQNAMVRVKREWGEHAMLQQAAIRTHDLNEIYKMPPKRLGAALWCGIDHQRGYHPDPFWGGLIDSYRIARYSYYLFKSQYAPELEIKGKIKTGPMVYIAHELTQISGRDVIVYSNCEEVRLLWLGKEAIVKKPIAEFRFIPHSPMVFKDFFDFHEISTNYRDATGGLVMVAEGVIGGKVVCKQEKRYPERLTGIALELDDCGVPLVADGSDFIPVRASLVDNKGVRKVLSNEYVYFEVSGEGAVIGDLSNHANPMRTQFGVATALIRATKTAGKIYVNAYVDGLEPANIVFESVPAALPLLLDKNVPIDVKKNYGRAVDETAKRKKWDDSSDMKEMQAEIKSLRIQLTAKTQEVMELKSRG